MNFVHFFDASILHFINGFAHRSWTFDSFVVILESSGLIRGGVLAALLWWVWFRPDQNEERRELLLCTLFSSVIAIVVARTLSLVAPFRLRPVHDPDLHIRVAYNFNSSMLINWSSFPSDHAALFFAFATGLFFVSRRIGIFAASYVFFIICLPRIYLGIHYPTDILVGALIGVGIACLGQLPKIRHVVARPALHWLTVSPSFFYTCLFLLTDEVAHVFSPLQKLAKMLLYVIKHFATRP